MAFCVHCGQMQNDGTRFCRFCGGQQPGEQLVARLRISGIHQIPYAANANPADAANELRPATKSTTLVI